MIRLPRPLLVMIAAAFAAFNVALGLSSIPIDLSSTSVRVMGGLAVYCGAVVIAVTVGPTVRMPTWLAWLTVVASAVVTLVVASTLHRDEASGYDTWYVGAVGSLLTIVAVRRHTRIAWFGLALLVVHTVVWSGPLGILRLGVTGDLIWVAIADMFTRAIRRATNDVHSYAEAERETVEWQAAQDAHHYERQVRLGQTARTALPMLTRIVRDRGELDAAGRQECRVLEQSIRDEIRGRRLLNDAVREQVLAHRRRGALVQVLDDGGLDDVPPELLDPVLHRVAAELDGLTSDRIVLRTAPKGSTKAVTVVAISSDSEASALGLHDDEEQVDLWLELDRPVPVPTPA